jgi:diguanylate cyclase (GGDEF)-like protein
MSALLDLLLGTDPHQRLRLRRMLMASAVYIVCVLLQWQAVWFGHTAPSTAAWFSLFLVLGVAGFYVTIRSGVSRRFAEPALTMPQMVFGVISIALAYLIDQHVRGAMLALATLVLIFGAFTLAPVRCRQLGWVAAGVLVAVMAGGAIVQPDRFEPEIELVHALFALTVLPTTAILAGQLSELRIDHQHQRRELRAALDRLEALAMHDDLTGLPNRRHINDWLADEAARSERRGQPLAIAIIDLDHFKRVNDTHGHAVGDGVLRTFAVQAGATLRDGDVLARWGGEEFLLALPDTGAAAAQRAIERLRAVMARDEAWVDCPEGRVTFSAGVVVLQPGQVVDDALRRADAALYRAKRSGRDRAVFAPSLDDGGDAHEATA